MAFMIAASTSSAVVGGTGREHQRAEREPEQDIVRRRQRGVPLPDRLQAPVDHAGAEGRDDREHRGQHAHRLEERADLDALKIDAEQIEQAERIEGDGEHALAREPAGLEA
jgi:hypothetical protein